MIEWLSQAVSQQGALALAILAGASLVRAAFGFGDALIAMPLLAMLIGVRDATGLVGLAGMSLSILMLWNERQAVDFRGAWRLILASCMGIPVGLHFLKHGDERIVKFVLSAVIIGFSLFKLLRPALGRLKSDNAAFLFGFCAGVLGGAYNSDGPPLVIYGSLKRWSPQAFRATLAGIFATTGWAILIGQASAGLWTANVMQLYVLALPLVAAAALIGKALHRVLPPGKFDFCIHAMLIVIGAGLLADVVRALA
ncbi:MAG: Sulfite exporter TauE/SafE [candidate division BRC1 bacterium ADurb.BinA364]|nr:MAG: Sulfite exporter TauE/SafE [candidate division BRC1 bacterium ADurb.BinA364]